MKHSINTLCAIAALIAPALALTPNNNANVARLAQLEEIAAKHDAPALAEQLITFYSTVAEDATEERSKLLRESQKTWDTYAREAIALAQATNPSSAETFAKQLDRQRVMEIIYLCEGGLGDGLPAIILEDYAHADISETEEKYADPKLEKGERAAGTQRDMNELAADILHHYIRVYDDALTARADGTQEAIEHPEMSLEFLDITIKVQKAYHKHLHSCLLIASLDGGSIAPLVACSTGARFILWQLHSLDEYLPLAED